MVTKQVKRIVESFHFQTPYNFFFLFLLDIPHSILLFVASTPNDIAQLQEVEIYQENFGPITGYPPHQITNFCLQNQN